MVNSIKQLIENGCTTTQLWELLSAIPKITISELFDIEVIHVNAYASIRESILTGGIDNFESNIKIFKEEKCAYTENAYLRLMHIYFNLFTTIKTGKSPSFDDCKKAVSSSQFDKLNWALEEELFNAFPSDEIKATINGKVDYITLRSTTGDLLSMQSLDEISRADFNTVYTNVIVGGFITNSRFLMHMLELWMRLEPEYEITLTYENWKNEQNLNTQIPNETGIEIKPIKIPFGKINKSDLDQQIKQTRLDIIKAKGKGGFGKMLALQDKINILLKQKQNMLDIKDEIPF